MVCILVCIFFDSFPFTFKISIVFRKAVLEKVKVNNLFIVGQYLMFYYFSLRRCRRHKQSATNKMTFSHNISTVNRTLTAQQRRPWISLRSQTQTFSMQSYSLRIKDRAIRPLLYTCRRELIINHLKSKSKYLQLTRIRTMYINNINILVWILYVYKCDIIVLFLCIIVKHL